MDLFGERGASPMLIAMQTQAFDDSEWIYELKLDGIRCLAYFDKNTADFRNKRNLQINAKFPELGELNQNVSGKCILDGEIVILNKGVPDFYRLQKRTLLSDPFKIQLESIRHPASFVAFDCIYKGAEDLTEKPLLARKDILAGILQETSRMAVSRYIETNGTALYRAAEQQELEGIVAKRKNSIYTMGKRSRDWLKCKRMADEEFIIVGYIQKGQHFFNVILAKYKQGLLVYKGHVTAGVTKEIISQLEETRENPFCLLPPGNEEAVWVKPNRVCVVEYMPNTKQTLRQPVFKGIRTDVSPEEVIISG